MRLTEKEITQIGKTLFTLDAVVIDNTFFRKFCRLFDSQNNNRGGYNVGSLYYYAGSTLSLEWTNQHSCRDANNHCEIIFQYMCADHIRDGVITSTIPDQLLRCENFNCNEDIK